MSQRGPSKKIANSLVAMSSAAVLAVYAAGYSRTKTAADQLEAKSAERHPGPGGTGRGPSPIAAVPRQQILTVAPTPAPETKVETNASGTVAASLKNTPVGAPETKVAAVAAETALTSATPATAVPSPTPAPVEATPPVAEHKAEIAVVPPAPAPAPPPPPTPKWKDGTFTGWGTSRHGDIQASVVIEDGRIKSATIAQCLTRYSCDIIEKLPPQVAQRQSPETDFVSGATQSTNAFYYGVVDALSKAK